jgi:hypothetical protein
MGSVSSGGRSPSSPSGFLSASTSSSTAVLLSSITVRTAFQWPYNQELFLLECRASMKKKLSVKVHSVPPDLK